VPEVATIKVDPPITHVTDAGLLHVLVPGGLHRSIAGLVSDLGEQR
jgi:hypothetical protein